MTFDDLDKLQAKLILIGFEKRSGKNFIYKDIFRVSFNSSWNNTIYISKIYKRYNHFKEFNEANRAFDYIMLSFENDKQLSYTR